MRDLEGTITDLRSAVVLLETIHENAMQPLSGGMLDALVPRKEAGIAYFRLTEDQVCGLAYAIALVGDHVRTLAMEATP